MKTIDSVIKELQGLSNDAYARYIGQLRQDECLGAEYKMEKGKFNSDNLKAHCTALQWLGKHRAYEDSVRLLREVVVPKPNVKEPLHTDAPKDGTVFIVPIQFGYDRCFYDSGYWWYYRSDIEDEGSYAAGPEPEMWWPI